MGKLNKVFVAPWVRLGRAVRATFDLRDMFVFVGIGFAVYGGNTIYPGGGWFVGGAALFWLGARGT